MSPPGPTHRIMIREKGQPASIPPSPALPGWYICMYYMYMCICRFAYSDRSHRTMPSLLLAKGRDPLVVSRLNGKVLCRTRRSGWRVERGLDKAWLRARQGEELLEKRRVQVVRCQRIVCNRGIPAVVPTLLLILPPSHPLSPQIYLCDSDLSSVHLVISEVTSKYIQSNKPAFGSAQSLRGSYCQATLLWRNAPSTHTPRHR